MYSDKRQSPATYIGERKRALETRINEHKKDLGKKSVVAAHAIDNVHEIKWKDVKILDKEPNYNKRIISEMLHINCHGVDFLAKARFTCVP